MRSSNSLLRGRRVDLVAIGHGSSVRYTRTVLIAAAKSLSSTMPAVCSPAVIVLGLPTQASRESAHFRGLWKAQKIRMRLGGSANMLEDFPEKPKGMHWRTYERLRRVHDAAQGRSIIGLTDFANRLSKRVA